MGLIAIRFAIVGMDMQRDEVDTRSDVALFQFFDETCPVDTEMFDVESQHVKMPGILRLSGTF